MLTDSTLIQYKTTAGVVSQAIDDETGSVRQTSAPAVPASTSNYHVAISVDVSALVSFLIYSSQDVTIKTNSSSSPAQTFTVKAGIGFTWALASGKTNPLTLDITDIYITNAGGSASALQMSFLQS